MDTLVSEAAPEPAASFPTPERTGSCLGFSKRGFHNIAYVEWGDPASERVAVCVHGLSRQGRDFDRLAAALARRGAAGGWSARTWPAGAAATGCATRRSTTCRSMRRTSPC